MGTNNKERRRAKKQRRQSRDRQHSSGASREQSYAGHSPHGPTTSASWPYLVDTLVLDAAHAGCEGHDAEALLARLTDREAGTGWCWLVTDRVASTLTEQVTRVLHGGWEPRDISAVVRRKVGPTAANITEAVLPEAVLHRRPGPPTLARWEGQLEELAPGARALASGSSAWEADIAAALTAIGYLAHLGPLPGLGEPGVRRAPRPDLDPGLLDKVRALLAKAEATDFEEEADAFLSKAQELMTRHNLDRAAVEATGHDGPAGVEARRCWLDDPYLKQKGYLLAVVAKANRCRSVSLYDYGFVTLFGHPDDLGSTEMLFTALLVHATKQMTLPMRAGTSAPSMERRGASRPSYRRSFLLAYANRIGARLSEASASATQAAVSSVGDALLPVLASRERGVEEAVGKMFPETTKFEYSITDYAGWAAGQAAADLADLSWQPKLAGANA